MLGINETSSIGQFIVHMTNNVTGSVFITFLVIFMIVLTLFVMFRVPPFLISLFILPFALVIMAFYSDFMLIGGLLLLFIGVLFSLNYFIK